MLVFVDESGDPGMKLGRGSSEFFVVTAVWFEDRDEAIACDRRISILRQELGLSNRKEFHFSKDNQAIRRRFLEAVVAYEFFYFAVAIDKKNLAGPGFLVKESFYKYASTSSSKTRSHT